MHARILTVVDGSSSGLYSAKSSCMCESQAERRSTLVYTNQALRSVPMHSSGQSSRDRCGVQALSLYEAACVAVMSEKEVKVDNHEVNKATIAADTSALIPEEVYVYRD